tara:strand:- start:69 stop:302 length:234 start_codon:yes stop_codon:yes gene_type:complete
VVEALVQVLALVQVQVLVAEAAQSDQAVVPSPLWGSSQHIALAGLSALSCRIHQTAFEARQWKMSQHQQRGSLGLAV